MERLSSHFYDPQMRIPDFTTACCYSRSSFAMIRGADSRGVLQDEETFQSW